MPLIIWPSVDRPLILLFLHVYEPGVLHILLVLCRARPVSPDLLRSSQKQRKPMVQCGIFERFVNAPQRHRRILHLKISIRSQGIESLRNHDGWVAEAREEGTTVYEVKLMVVLPLIF